jgi:16S rRNA (adenine1518-N6/adenine1519-N6)-dimethyltransferase
LQNQDIVIKICDSVDITGSNVLEIGAGMGILTSEILKNKPKSLFVIEKDGRMMDFLKPMEIEHSNLSIINSDALKFKLVDVVNTCYKVNGENVLKLNIIANLPYNIGTTLVLNWMEEIDLVKNIVVMLQKEVVMRIVATPKSKDYGRISVLIQSLCDVEKLFDISPDNFFPRPKVMSSVVKITPKKNRISMDEYKKIDCICKKFFSQRRKTINNILKHEEGFFKKELPSFITNTTRAEELSVADYLKIINCI